MSEPHRVETDARPVYLSLFWFFYFAGQGIFFPYYSLYLRENAGLSGTSLGLVLAALPAAGILAQPFWGQVADRSGTRSRILAIVTVASAIGYTSLAAVSGFVPILLTTAALALFATTVVPLGVSVSLAQLGRTGSVRFGLVRVWGTVGFLLLVAGFPAALHSFARVLDVVATAGGPSEPALALMFPATGLLVLAAALAAARLPPENGGPLRAAAGDWRILLRHGPVLRLLLFTLLAFFCLQGPMMLFPVYIRSLHGTMSTVGRMWILMLALEIPLVAGSGRGLARIGARGLLAAGVAAGGLRWLICGLSHDLRLIYPIQILHGVVVAGLMIGGPLYLEAAVPARLRSTGQTLLSMAGMGVAAIASNITSGWLLDHAGIHAPYLFGGIGALLLAALAPWILPPPSRPRDPSC